MLLDAILPELFVRQQAQQNWFQNLIFNQNATARYKRLLFNFYFGKIRIESGEIPDGIRNFPNRVGDIFSTFRYVFNIKTGMIYQQTSF